MAGRGDDLGSSGGSGSKNVAEGGGGGGSRRKTAMSEASGDGPSAAKRRFAELRTEYRSGGDDDDGGAGSGGGGGGSSNGGETSAEGANYVGDIQKDDDKVDNEYMSSTLKHLFERGDSNGDGDGWHDPKSFPDSKSPFHVPEKKKTRLINTEKEHFEAFGRNFGMFSYPGTLKVGKVFADKYGRFLTTQSLLIPVDSIINILLVLQFFLHSLLELETESRERIEEGYFFERPLTERRPKPNNFVVKAVTYYNKSENVLPIFRLIRYYIEDLNDPSKDVRCSGIITVSTRAQALDFLHSIYGCAPFTMFVPSVHIKALTFFSKKLYSLAQKDCESLFEAWIEGDNRGVLRNTVKVVHSNFPSDFGFNSLYGTILNNLKPIYAQNIAQRLIRDNSKLQCGDSDESDDK